MHDLFLVGINKFFVVVDAGNLDKCDECKSKDPIIDDISKVIDLSNLSSYGGVPLMYCRAALFSKIVSLVNTQSVSSVVVSRLCKFLELGIVPVLTSEATAGIELIGALTFAPAARCYYNNSNDSKSADSFINELGPFALNINSVELKYLISGHFFAVGVGCLLGACALANSQCLDCISSLTCEALGNDGTIRNNSIIASLDSQQFDVGRQHRGQMASASNIRLLLEGSTRVTAQNNSKVSEETVAVVTPSIFLHLPHVHGPVLETMTATVK